MGVGETTDELVVIAADVGEGVGDVGGVEVEETDQVDVKVVEVFNVEQCEGQTGGVCQEREEVVEAVPGGQLSTGQQLVQLVLQISSPLHVPAIKVFLSHLRREDHCRGQSFI